MAIFLLAFPEARAASKELDRESHNIQVWGDGITSLSGEKVHSSLQGPIKQQCTILQGHGPTSHWVSHKTKAAVMPLRPEVKKERESAYAI